MNEGYAAGEARCRDGVGGVSPPTGRGFGGPPQEHFQKLTPIFFIVRHFEVIFVTFTKAIFFGIKSCIVFEVKFKQGVVVPSPPIEGVWGTTPGTFSKIIPYFLHSETF